LQLTAAGHDLAPLFNIIGRIRTVALALTLMALAYSLVIWIKPELSAGLTERLIASGASAMALAEYINYYHRQLQHFDNMADFKRLLTGKGFRRSQMAVDLETAKVGAAAQR
jgi:hypothetical protein